MIHSENLNIINRLLEQISNTEDQNEINRIGDEYKPIADYYVKASTVAKGGKAVYTFSLGDVQNLMEHWNHGAPLIYIKKSLNNNLKILRMHIMDLCEKNNEQVKSKPLNSVTTYNIYGDNNIVNNGNIYGDVMAKIDSLNIDASEKEDIKNQIELIQMILESKDSKEKKWSKLKNIGKWIFDKSVDVGIALLPLFINLK